MSGEFGEVIFLRIEIYIEMFRLDEIPFEVAVLDFVLSEFIDLGGSGTHKKQQAQ